MQLIEMIENVGIEEKQFNIGKDTFYREEDGSLILIYHHENGNFEYRIKEIDELYEGDRDFDYQDDSWHDQYLPLLLAIETTILDYYGKNPAIKDKTIITILDKLARNPGITFPNQLLENIQRDLRLSLSINSYSKSEVVGSFKRVLKSAKNHHRTDGPRGYLEFIHEFLTNG